MDTFVGKYERVHEENYEELLKVKFLTLTLNLALVAISTFLRIFKLTALVWEPSREPSS